MKVIVDTRETRPLVFPKGYSFIEDIINKKCDVGDYMVEFKDGYVPPFSVERKSLGDLFGTLTSNYDTFKREINRAHDSGTILVIVIENNIFDVRRG